MRLLGTNGLETVKIIDTTVIINKTFRSPFTYQAFVSIQLNHLITDAQCYLHDRTSVMKLSVTCDKSRVRRRCKNELCLYTSCVRGPGERLMTSWPLIVSDVFPYLRPTAGLSTICYTTFHVHNILYRYTRTSVYRDLIKFLKLSSLI